jgi:hypothetical protein
MAVANANAPNALVHQQQEAANVVPRNFVAMLNNSSSKAFNE